MSRLAVRAVRRAPTASATGSELLCPRGDENPGARRSSTLGVAGTPQRSGRHRVTIHAAPPWRMRVRRIRCPGRSPRTRRLYSKVAAREIACRAVCLAHRAACRGTAALPAAPATGLQTSHDRSASRFAASSSPRSDPGFTPGSAHRSAANRRLRPGRRSPRIAALSEVIRWPRPSTPTWTRSSTRRGEPRWWPPPRSVRSVPWAWPCRWWQASSRRSAPRPLARPSRPTFPGWQPANFAASSGAAIRSGSSAAPPRCWRRLRRPTTRSSTRSPRSTTCCPTPSYAKNEARAIKPEYLIVVGICSHLGCSPSDRFQPGPQPSLPDDWPGGFFCPCHGSTFDIAGRVFREQAGQCQPRRPAAHLRVRHDDPDRPRRKKRA